jgi:FKBP-type peptidyl-prolyl cis-trans isomerase
LVDGRVFDQTPPGQAASFPAGHLIPGWVEALSKMKEGDEWELVIPAALGYGAEGAGSDIPPNATLVFTLSLISVAPAQN